MKAIVKYSLVLLGAGAALFSCRKSKLPNEDGPGEENNPFPFGYGLETVYTSRNQAFEKDWASQDTLELVTDYYKENDKLIAKSISVALPWAYERGPRQWLPQYTARNMVELNRDDWRLVFNLTGIDQKPGEHFFGLYNRFTGTLRVFYYLTEDRLPSSDGNDHMWSMGFTKDLVEHVVFQYAIPYEEEVPEQYKQALGGNDAMFKTTALTGACSDLGKVTPALGWWAYDINLSPLRSHDFFASERSVMTPGMLVYNEDNVVLHSVLKGNLDGTFGGNMNLNSLKGGGTNGWGVASGVIGNFCQGFLSNTKFIEQVIGDHQSKGKWISPLLGAALGTIGKGLESNLKNGAQDPDKLGDFNGTINLTLDANIDTWGTIGGARTSRVPSPNLNVAGFFRRTTSDDQPTGFGEGVWNISHHPVIYVVSDAYYGDKPQFSSVEKVKSEGRTAYALTLDPDKVGLSNIIFMDPTSMGDIHFNPNSIPEGATSLEVVSDYVVFQNATPGYTDGFRELIGLSYENPELTSKSSYQTDENVGFRIIKKYHADPVFLSEIEEELADVVGDRLSQQQLSDKIHRRLFGASYYFTKPNAGYDEVDNVAFVASPKVFLPVNSKDRLLFGTELPDFVVSVTLQTKGAPNESGDRDLMINTLRFLPRIVFIKLSEVRKVCGEIQKRGEEMLSGGGYITYPQLAGQLKDIKRIVDTLPPDV